MLNVHGVSSCWRPNKWDVLDVAPCWEKNETNQKAKCYSSKKCLGKMICQNEQSKKVSRINSVYISQLIACLKYVYTYTLRQTIGRISQFHLHLHIVSILESTASIWLLKCGDLNLLYSVFEDKSVSRL